MDGYKAPQKFHVKVRVFNNELAFGKGVAELMELTERFGSLRAAYQSMGMSSSKAWKILRRAERDIGHKLIEATAGGAHGGSAVLTEEGKTLLAAYSAFDREVQEQAEKSFAKYFGTK